MADHNELKAKTILLQKRALLETIKQAEDQKEKLETHLMNLKLTVEAFDDALSQIPVQIDLFEKELDEAEAEAEASQSHMDNLAAQAASSLNPTG